MQFEFAKLNGLGNSFILMNDLNGEISGKVDIGRLAEAICDVGFGIGADGLILAKPSTVHDYRMVIINSDGSEAEMCGNGIRCLARFLADENITDQQTLTFETLAGPIRTVLKPDNQVEVDMGHPVFRNGDVVAPAGEGMVTVTKDNKTFAYVSMGNPHAVTFVDAFDFDWRNTGAVVENATDIFPNRVNVEFGRVENRQELTMKVWERGCGETQACGTGTCALVVAAVHEDKVGEGDVLVHLPGGDLSIRYVRGETVRMTGPAVHVCKGHYFYE